MNAHSRLRLLQALGLAGFALLALQLVRMQVIDAARYRELASTQRMRSLPVEAPRGLVLDRRGTVLARNEPRFSLLVVPGYLPSDSRARNEVLRAVERAAAVPFADLEHAVGAGARSVDPFAPVTVRANLDAQTALDMRVVLTGLPAVRVEATPARVYESGDLLPHVLGYVGPINPGEVRQYTDRGYQLNAIVGRSGVEASYERELRGGTGRRLVAADPSGRELARLGSVAATPGADVVLSIDVGLQRAVTEALRGGIASGLAMSGRKGPPVAAGSAVVLDVRTGEVLALASLPSYDVNVLAGSPDQAAVERLLGDPARPLIHRGYMEVKAPGSIFKPLVGTAALQEGVASPSTTITSRGAISVRDEYNPAVSYTFKDWAVLGTLNFYGGMAMSSDVYFYYLAGGYAESGRRLFDGLGAERIARYARAFGLGQATGLDLPGETDGLVPDAAWKRAAVGDEWVLGDTYTYAIGQGYLTVTQLQMAVASAALANGGDVLVPRVVRGLQRGEQLSVSPRTVRGRLPADPGNIAIVREAMRVAASPGGTASEGRPANLAIGGKTGTAEFGPRYADGSYDTHAWYMGFAPYENPEIAVVVQLEYGVGATHAAPVARRIFEEYFARYRVTPPEAPR